MIATSILACTAKIMRGMCNLHNKALPVTGYQRYSNHLANKIKQFDIIYQ